MGPDVSAKLCLIPLSQKRRGTEDKALTGQLMLDLARIWLKEHSSREGDSAGIETFFRQVSDDTTAFERSCWGNPTRARASASEPLRFSMGNEKAVDTLS
jgi:hypothetical protein